MSDPTQNTISQIEGAVLTAEAPALAAHPTVLLVLHLLAGALAVLVAAGVIPTSGEAAQVTLIVGTLLAPFGYAQGHATVRRAAAGFASLLLMLTLASVGVLLVLAGCNTLVTDATGAIDCAKAEEAIAKDDLLHLAFDVGAALSAIAAGGVDAIPGAIEPLITKYGEPIVACAINKAAPGLAGALDSGALHAELVPSPKLLVEAHYGWRFAK